MYHIFKEPCETDEEYDALKRKYMKLTRDNPQLANTIPRARSIADQMRHLGMNVKHDFPMLPLREADSLHGLVRWFNTFDTEHVTIEPSLEGIGVELVYVGGMLHKAVNWGDGLVGKDITMHMYRVDGVPQLITETERVNLHGKIVISKSDLAKLPDLEHVTPGMAVAQILMNRNTELNHRNDLLSFIPTEINIPGCTFDRMELNPIAANWGFNVTPMWVFDGKCREPGALEEGIDAFIEKQLTDYIYSYSGLEFKVLETQRRLDLGYTSRYPEWAVKYTKGKSNECKVSDTNVGKSDHRPQL